MRVRGPWIGMVLVVIACSDRALDDAEGTGGTSLAGTHGSDGPGADETGAPACEWVPEPFVGVSGGPGCEALASGGQTAPVRVRIVNDGAAPIDLVGPVPCTSFYFLVEDAAGLVFPPPHCTTVCDDAVLHQCGCTLECPLTPTVTLHPGGVYEQPWDGIVAELLEASIDCAGDCAGPCARATNPGAGRLSVSIARASALDCGDACECEPNAEGWCEAPGSPMAPPTFVALEATWPPPCGALELHVP